jgi:hypothetical protein
MALRFPDEARRAGHADDLQLLVEVAIGVIATEPVLM